MKNRLERRATERARLVGHREAGRGVSAGIDVPALHARPHYGAGWQQAAKNPRDNGPHRHAVHRGDGFPRLDLIPDLPEARQYAVRRRAQHALCAVTGDFARGSGIGQGRALIVNTAEVMSPHGFNRRMAVGARREAGAERDDDWRVRAGRAGVFFSKNRVDERVGTKRRPASRLRIDQHRDASAADEGARVVRAAGKPRRHTLHNHASVKNRLAERDRSADGGGMGDFSQNNVHPRPIKPDGDACCKITRAADQYEHIIPSRSL